ncbi:MAG: DUF4199 domain-containing protein [Lewinellaceae bacterium]|nr:DUF4199 domain-containing protein [Lewinellaceae bacterium]
MKNKSVLFGSIAGIVTIAFFIVVYLIDKPLVFSPWIAYSPILLYIAAMYLAGVNTREAVDGPFPWRDALKVAFLTYLVANGWFYLFYYIGHQVDPSLAELQKEIMREALPQYTEPAKLPEAYKQLDEQSFQPSLGQTILGWAQGAILGFGLAALVALLTRRDYSS